MKLYNQELSKSFTHIAMFLCLFMILILCQSCGSESSEGSWEGTSNITTTDATNAVQHKSAIAIYPWGPINKTKILPTTFPLPVAKGKSLSIQAARGEFEPTSFIVRSGNIALSGIQINAGDLTGTGQQKIPASAVDIRLVKCWYQSGNSATIYNQHKSVLVPELLLRDDALVRVDTVKKMNYLKTSLNGIEQYIDISSPDAVFPDNAVIKDADTLQPFNLDAHTNKQVWVTVHVPESTPSGKYNGSIQITVPGEDAVTLSLNVTVLPFDLPQPAIEYSMYYEGMLSATPPNNSFSLRKTPEQYLAEMVNMRDHGIVSPTLYQGAYGNILSLVRQALDIRKQAGIAGESLYLEFSTANLKDTNSLTALRNSVENWKALATEFGYKDLYMMGIDEATGATLNSERTAWEIVHNAGAKVFVACDINAVDIVGDLLDLAVLSGALKPITVDKWHTQGKKVFSYANPQVGLEDPLVYRQHYGLALWLAGYDGVMDFAYQYPFGNIWNDFDRRPDVTYRDLVFAYPTSNGVIDTVQWEGFRQGVDDVRYLTALLNRQNKATVKTWLKGKLSSNPELGSVRKAIINKIING